MGSKVSIVSSEAGKNIEQIRNIHEEKNDKHHLSLTDIEQISLEFFFQALFHARTINVIIWNSCPQSI